MTERIEKAAVMTGDLIYSVPRPLRHPDILCVPLVIELAREHGSVHGFMTNKLRFVNRTEAYQIAKDAGQLLPEDRPGHTPTPGTLYTEDLW